MNDETKGKDMPEGGAIDADLPVRPPGGGYGATSADIARGYCAIPDTDTDSRTGTYPPSPTLRRDSGLI